MKMYDYLIVGAGLYGATLAHELTKHGKKVLVIDKRSHIGGNIYTKRENGIDIHVYGPHIFHTSNKEIWDYVNSLTKFNSFINTPLAIYKNEIYNLPFNMNTFSRLFNIITPEEAKKIIDKEKKNYFKENPSNLEEQAINLVGITIYEKLIKGYTAKQWGRPCNELPPFIINRIPVRYTYDNNYFDDTYQGIPDEGYTKLIEKLLEGSDVRLNYEFINNIQSCLRFAKDIIYTGPIDEFFDYCYGPLEYRSVRFETTKLNIKNYQGNAVINYTEFDIPYTRVIEHKHFMNKCDSDVTIISKEFPSTWNVGDERYYPVNDSKNNELYKKYFELSKTNEHIFFGGRLGLYRYLDMDDVIKLALEQAKFLLEK